jgi:hypothetical protein
VIVAKGSEKLRENINAKIRFDYEIQKSTFFIA